MTISGATRLYAVLGRPVHHSGSPRLHNTWFAAKNIDARYVALDVPPELAHQVPDALRTLGLAGANLTVPLKEAVLPHLDHLAPSASAAGAANVVVRTPHGLVGHNTDGSGLLAHLRSRGFTPDHPVVVLGAGGAGRAVTAAMVAAGVPRVHLLNRTEARAAAVADQLGPAVAPGPLTPSAFAQLAEEVHWVVQATSGGARAALEALDPTRLSPACAWVDLNYWDPSPPHRDTLAARNMAFDDGHGMLIAQAVEAFTLFTGVPLSLPEARALLDRTAP